MALITCPECGGLVSDKATTCIHCGYPMNTICDTQISKNTSVIDGVEYDFSEIKTLFDNGHPYTAILELAKREEFIAFRGKQIIPYLSIHYEKYGDFPKILDSNNLGMSKKEIDKLSTEILVRYKRDETTEKRITKASSILTCPKCGSAAVAIGTKGYSLFSGFRGSNQTMNRCGNCGYKWKPTF